jgi:hypothetical protein
MKRVIIRSATQRATAHRYVDECPEGWEVLFQEHKPNKTSQQRGYWHAMLAELSEAVGVPAEKLKLTVKVGVLGLSEHEDARGRIYLAIPSSERQTRETYAKLIDFTLQMAADEFGVVLPPPRWTEGER